MAMTKSTKKNYPEWRKKAAQNPSSTEQMNLDAIQALLSLPRLREFTTTWPTIRSQEQKLCHI